MVNWESPEEQERDGSASVAVVYALTGIYLFVDAFIFWVRRLVCSYEFMISLGFEWSFIRGHRKFHWPMVVYFLCRVINSDMSMKLDCRATTIATSISGSLMVGFSSTNLAIRTMVVWSMKRTCVIPLVLMVFGHWAILLQNVPALSMSVGSTPEGGCILAQNINRRLSFSFIYSICIDFVVLALCAFKLFGQRAGSTRSRLVKLIFKDGLVYFFIVFLVNVPAAVITLLQLNPAMDTILALPVSVVSVIASSRAVRRLSNFTASGPIIHMARPGPEPIVLRHRTVDFNGPTAVATNRLADDTHMLVKLEESPATTLCRTPESERVAIRPLSQSEILSGTMAV